MPGRGWQYHWVPLLAIALVLVSAVAHALWNLAAKRVGGGALFVWLHYSASAVLCLPVAVVWLVSQQIRPEWTWLPVALLTAALHVVYGVVLQRGYAVGDMSVVYPLARGSGPLLTVVVAVAALAERPGALGLAGAGLVVAGVLVIGTGGGGGDARSRRRGAVYGLATGAVIAGYTLWDAHAVTVVGVPPLLYFSLAVMMQGLLLAPRAAGHGREVAALLRQHGREVATVAVLSPAAYLLVLYAMRLAPVSLVAPAREFSIVLGSLLGWLALAEPDPGRRVAGAAVVVAGVVLIGMA